MRLSLLTAIAVSLIAVGTATAQPEQDDAPYPTASGESARPAGPSGPAMPAWQALPGGYGGWHGGYADGHDSCCGSCNSCCHSCRPGLICRLKALKCRICSRWACRRCCRSCCGSCCSDCAMHDVPPPGMPMAPRQGDLLPVPPAETAPYTGDADESLPEQSPHRPTSARTKVKQQRYSMPHVSSASKTTKSKKKR